MFAHLEPLGTARRGRKDVVGVHGAEDEVRPVPLLQAVPAVDGGGPAFKTAHTHGGKVVHLALVLDLDAAGFVVLPGGEEEGAVDQGVTVEDVHNLVADDAGNPVHLIACKGGENENSGLIISYAALVLHLKILKKKP